MNNFADSLLTMLLSWVRSFMEFCLSLLQYGSTSFLHWVKDNWLWLALSLIGIGIIIDCILYIIRWQPHHVWRTTWRNLFRKRASAAVDPYFSQGYNDALTGFNFADAPIHGLNSIDASIAGRLEQYYHEPATTPNASLASLQSSTDESVVPTRRRRSAKHHKKLFFRFLHHNKLHTSVSPNSAFHDVVYPSIDAPSWHTPNNSSENGQMIND